MLESNQDSVDFHRYFLERRTKAARAAVAAEVTAAVKLLAVAIRNQQPHARFAALRPADYGKWMTLHWVGNDQGERVADDATIDAGLLETHSAETHLYPEYFETWGRPYLYDYRARHRRPTDCSADHDTYLDLQKILESN